MQPMGFPYPAERQVRRTSDMNTTAMVTGSPHAVKIPSRGNDKLFQSVVYDRQARHTPKWACSVCSQGPVCLPGAYGKDGTFSAPEFTVTACAHAFHPQCFFAWLLEAKEYWGGNEVGQCEGCIKLKAYVHGMKWSPQHLSKAMDRVSGHLDWMN